MVRVIYSKHSKDHLTTNKILKVYKNYKALMNRHSYDL